MLPLATPPCTSSRQSCHVCWCTCVLHIQLTLSPREMPPSRSPSISSRIIDDNDNAGPSSSTGDLTMSQSHASRRLPAPQNSEFSTSAALLAMQRARSAYNPAQPVPFGNQHPNMGQPQQQEDHFQHLRKHNLGTKEAWTAIPASEGFRILELCRSMSATSSSSLAVRQFQALRLILVVRGGSRSSGK